MALAIRATGVSKCYRLGQRGYRTLREDIVSTVARTLQGHSSTSSTPQHWALRDVSFDVERGQVVGIVGRNGAGKSTLLKILSRITLPTAGQVEVRGRIGSLLEVGTGFHHELTGRENIYLSGAILGMRHAEIERRFDEIVAFAEIGKFLETPVKRYSSGMYLRLAFAVAAHLQPEILLIDELLAVGDIEFQRKCIGRMEKVAREGRTVLLVSHNMGTVRALCSRAILLEEGRVVADGPAEAVVAQYLNAARAGAARCAVGREAHHVGGMTMRVTCVSLRNGVGGAFSVHWRQPLELVVEVEVDETVAQVAFGAGIRALDGTHVFHVHHDDDGQQPLWSFEPGRYEVEIVMANPLRPGTYRLHLGADREHLMTRPLFGVDPVLVEVLPFAEDGSAPLASNTGIINGASHWQTPRAVPSEARTAAR